MSPYRKRIWCASLTLGLVVLFAGAAAQGETISVVAANVSQTLIFQESVWDIPGAPLTNGSVVGEFGEVWFIAPSGMAPPASFTWTGNLLEEDLSAGGLADGVFLGGGTMSITGQLWDFTPFPQLKYNGLILQGDVSAFRMTETGVDTNFIDLNGDVVTTFEPTGGYLTTNPSLAMQMVPYLLDATGQGCQQNDGDLENWVTPPVSCDLFEFVITIPEPTSLMTLGGMLACLALGRRRAR